LQHFHLRLPHHHLRLAATKAEFKKTYASYFQSKAAVHDQHRSPKHFASRAAHKENLWCKDPLGHLS